MSKTQSARKAPAAPAGSDNEVVRKAGAGGRGPRQGTKQALVRDLLSREHGASLDELVAATNWLPHTTRAALTGFRKRGCTLTKEKVEGVTRYRLSEGA